MTSNNPLVRNLHDLLAVPTNQVTCNRYQLIGYLRKMIAEYEELEKKYLLVVYAPLHKRGENKPYPESVE